jgi:hypothetical protein
MIFMEEYIKQLREDLEAAQDVAVPPLSYGDSENIAKTSLERLSGLGKNCFPPVEKLSHQQLQDLVKAMYAFIESKKHIVNLPNELPLERTYQKLRDKWIDEIEHVEHGLAGLNFCPENLADCDMREFCGCCFECDPDDLPVYDGIYDDDGNKVDRLSIPIPELCLSCESFLDDDWEENILCDMTRADKREEGEEFMCYAWRKRREKGEEDE